MDFVLGYPINPLHVVRGFFILAPLAKWLRIACDKNPWGCLNCGLLLRGFLYCYFFRIFMVLGLKE